jgi:hypothetical protein
VKADLQGDAADLVLELTSPAPSAAFSLFKRSEDGKVTEFPLRVRLLREEETVAAIKEAQEYAKQFGEQGPTYGDIYKEAQACTLMARALCRPTKAKLPNGTEYYPQLFTETRQLRSSFTANEIAVCLNAHEVTKAFYRCSEDFSEAEIDKWAERFGDALTGPLWLSRLDSALWPELMWSLGRRVLELKEMLGLPPSTSLSSSGSQPDGSGDGTGGSTPSPYVVGSDGETLPDERLMTKAEADERARKMRDEQ